MKITRSAERGTRRPYANLFEGPYFEKRSIQGEVFFSDLYVTFSRGGRRYGVILAAEKALRRREYRNVPRRIYPGFYGVDTGFEYQMDEKLLLENLKDAVAKIAL